MLPSVKKGVIEVSTLRANVTIEGGVTVIHSLGVKKGIATLESLKELVSALEVAQNQTK